MICKDYGRPGCEVHANPANTMHPPPGCEGDEPLHFCDACLDVSMKLWARIEAGLADGTVTHDQLADAIAEAEAEEAPN